MKNALETAAERVRNLLFNTGALKSLYLSFLNNRRAKEELSRCRCIKMPRMPAHLFATVASKKKKGSQFSVRPSEKKLRTDFSNTVAEPKRNLNSTRVMRWKLKEQQLATRNLRSLKKQGSFEQSKKHRVTLLNLEKKGQPAPDWEELMRGKEERQFVVNRVIRYLSDI
jgi:hypothetical protein